MSDADRPQSAIGRTRGLAHVVTLPPPVPGFIGEGHTAVHVIDPREFARNDPFIVLADDRIDLPPGQRAGGPHPHAGFEIVTFAVEGEARDRDEGLLQTGDVLWMTAGSGVVYRVHRAGRRRASRTSRASTHRSGFRLARSAGWNLAGRQQRFV
jgi:redox-sensitive bicupin YhaK (pirin superfamily)